MVLSGEQLLVSSELSGRSRGMISAPNSAPGGLCWWPGRIKHDKNGEKWGGGNEEKLDLHLGLAPAAQLEQGSHRSCFLLGFSRCLLGMVESRVPPAGN